MYVMATFNYLEISMTNLCQNIKFNFRQLPSSGIKRPDCSFCFLYHVIKGIHITGKLLYNVLIKKRVFSEIKE